VRLHEIGIAQGAVQKIERQVQVVGSVGVVQVGITIRAIQVRGELAGMMMTILEGHILVLDLAEQDDDEEKGRRDKLDKLVGICCKMKPQRCNKSSGNSCGYYSLLTPKIIPRNPLN
jgi:hypothetical protein